MCFVLLHYMQTPEMNTTALKVCSVTFLFAEKRRHRRWRMMGDHT